MTRLSTQELDDVLAAHRPCNCDPKIHCLTCDVDKFTPWPCLTYRLARDLKAALKVVDAADHTFLAIAGGWGTLEAIGPTHEQLAAYVKASRSYDTEETQ